MCVCIHALLELVFIHNCIKMDYYIYKYIGMLENQLLIYLILFFCLNKNIYTYIYIFFFENYNNKIKYKELKINILIY